MADELYRRIDWFFNHESYQYTDVLPNTTVRVFRGRLTSDARKAAHIEDQIHFIGGGGKTRLDRRHHAVDAAVIALMQPGIAQTLAERDSLREAQWMAGKLYPDEIPWQEYPNPGTERYESFQKWLERMRNLLELLNDALDNNRIAVTQSMRLALGNSVVHDDTVHKLTTVPLKSAIDAGTIRKASTPALYCALTRLPEYNEQDGLPENNERVINVHGRRVGPEDEISFFTSAAAQIAVRGGSADIGSTIHHARIYRCWEQNAKGKRKIFYGMIRVFQTDLMRYRNEDLFHAPLLEQSVSMRYAENRTAKAVLEDRAEYVGWLAVGDTIEVDFSEAQLSGQIAEFRDFVRALPHGNSSAYTCWVVDGFFNNTTLRLRPRILSAEGLKKLVEKTTIQVPDGATKIIEKQGWLPSVNMLATYHPICRRCNALGEDRQNSQSDLPSSWQWCRDSIE